MNEECLNQCQKTALNLIGEDEFPSGGEIYTSEEFKSCINKYLSLEGGDSDIENLQACWIEILPKLREKYPYLEKE